MELFRQELYKLCRGKLFIGGAVFTVFIICLLFSFRVQEEIATVDGKFYRGYEAIQMNRKITREFEGILTDEKVNQIAEKYGFPKVVKENYGDYQDRNYLNNFVVTYLSDGYYRSWDDYKIATKTIPIEESELGRVKKETGKEISLSYVTGWFVFLEILEMGMMLGSILIILSVSLVFASENQCRMLPLIFTTQEGKGKDITAKIGASLFLTLMVYIGVICLDFLLCGLVYGFDGAWILTGFVFGWDVTLHSMVWRIPCLAFAGLELLSCLLGIIFLWAMILCISARSRNTFSAVSLSACLWGLPLLIRMFLGGLFGSLVEGTPIFLVMKYNILDIQWYWMIPVGFALTVTGWCILTAYGRYKAS